MAETNCAWELTVYSNNLVVLVSLIIKSEYTVYCLCCERFFYVFESCCLVVLATTEAYSKENKLVTHYLRLLAQNLAEASLSLKEIPTMLHERSKKIFQKQTNKNIILH